MGKDIKKVFETWAMGNGWTQTQVNDFLKSEKRILKCAKFIRPALNCPHGLRFGGEYLTDNFDKYDSDNDTFCMNCDAFKRLP